jgi:hypothetical protein
MGQSEFEKYTLEDGRVVAEATCPHDTTIKPRAIVKPKAPVVVEPKEKDLIAPVAQDVRIPLKSKKDE